MKAILFMLMGSMSMGSMNVSAKFVGSETQVTVMQMGMARGLFMALGCYIHCKCSSIEICSVPKELNFLLLMRALMGFASSMM